MPLPDLAERAVRGGVDVVQLREKDLANHDLRTLAIQILERIDDPNRLMINGSAAIARELGAGLHLPEGMAVSFDPKDHFFPRLSQSVHADSDFDDINQFDFFVAGHVFETRSKPGLSPLGLDGLHRIRERYPKPVLAIGGITPERVRPVLSVGAAGVAVISAINNSDDPESAAREFRMALENGRYMHDKSTISIQMNGKPVDIAPNQTVMDYLKSRGHLERLVVVELNGQILAKTAFATTGLAAGDRVEIVHFVGGG